MIYSPTGEFGVTSQDNLISLLFISSPFISPSHIAVKAAISSPYLLVAEFAVTVASFLAIFTVIFDIAVEL